MDATLRSLMLNRASAVALAALPILVGGYAPTSRATDIEVFFTSPVTTTGSKPNIIFILDTSTSMWTPTEVASDAYDPLATYSAAGCDTSAYYYVLGSGTPSCSSPMVTDANFYCTDTKAQIESGGRYTLPAKVAEQWNRSSGPPASRGTQWRSAQGTANTPLICQGDGTPPATTLAVNWTAISTQGVTFYDGNYLAWQASTGTGSSPRIDVMKDAVWGVAQNSTGINLSLMRHGYSSNLELIGDGPTCQPDPNPVEGSGNAGSGIVVMEMLDLSFDANLAKLEGKLFTDTVDDKKGCEIGLFTPNGRTPLGDTYYEAYAYYRGTAVAQKNANDTNGISSQFTLTSVDESRTAPGSGTYKSPIVDGCSKNYIVILSDGTTEQDSPADQDIKRLQEPVGTARRKFSDLVGACDDDPELDGITPTPAQCVDDLAEFMFKADASGSLDGIQNVKTFTIGFALDANAKDNAEPLLQDIARRGGGTYYEANDAASLQDAFEDILRAVLTDNATFTAPAVTVDSFNRTRNLDDVYVSLFGPDLTYRWYGNVKKFKVDDSGDIVDVTGAPAVDPADGFLLANARSEWSSGVDGKDIKLGGAAEQLPPWSGRRIYSNLANPTATGWSFGSAATANQLNAVKTRADAAALLGIGATDAVSASDLIDWLHGRDIDDVNGDGDTSDSRQDMGDPLHSRPVVLVYGGEADTPDPEDARLFVTTNDGFLHSIDTASGEEQWAFVPAELLGRARDLYVNDETQPEDREYGLDAAMRLLIFDNNRNGVIEPEDEAGKRDRAYLFYGMRRGGGAYSAMDVSNRDNPRLMWVTALPGAGQSWSTPQPARVKVGDTDRIVLIISGGYSTEHENAAGDPPAWQQYPDPNDPVGNRIYMVDAVTGALIWNAGLTGATGVDLELDAMKYAFAADVRVVDLSGDGFADRMYAADLGGQVWRFDIFNGKNPTGTIEGDRLVEGGVFASLGNAGDSTPSASGSRRFFYAPDAVPFELNGRSIVNVGIGSGHREYPATDKITRNGFFSMRDLNRYTALLSSQYQATCTGALAPCHEIITESDGDLVDLTSIVGQDATNLVPENSRGWKIWLDGLGFGEKVLSEARTLGGTTFFSTYEPTPREERPEVCAINFGKNRLYVVSLLDARPVYNDDSEFNTDTDGDGEPDQFRERPQDRSTELTQSGIASEVVFLFTDQLVPGTTTGERRVFCLAGFARCPPGLSVAPVRTYWRQRGAE